ncbi:MAG: ABC transporter ATP-binding protein [Anaerolineaceae bacterium]
MLEIRDLTKRYRNGTLANDGLSLALEPGEVYGLLGPNGAGKTTLVRQVLGLLKPTSGSIRLDGQDVVANPGFARRTVGFLPQGQFDIGDVHVDELIYSVGKLRGLSSREARRRRDELIERLDLEPFRSTTMHAASGGVRRLAGFATALVAGNRLLVLDEPTNDVDPIRRQTLWHLVSEAGEAGAAVLLVTHNLAEAERFIHRLAIIDHGRILSEGSPASLRSLVTEKLRLELVLAGEVVPHPALTAEPGSVGSFLFEQSDLSFVSAWLTTLRTAGTLLDFRIGPPNLDDIYVAAVSGPGTGGVDRETALVAS